MLIIQDLFLVLNWKAKPIF